MNPEKPYKAIWLQPDPDGETTWCEDKQNTTDVKYVLAETVKELEAELIRLTECEELYRRVAEGLITELREGEK